LKIAWLCPYPIEFLQPEIKLKRRQPSFHPCNWIINLSAALSNIPDVELHIITLSPLIDNNQLILKNNIHFHIIRFAVPFSNRGFPSYLPFNMLTRFIFERVKLVAEIKRIQPDIVHSHGTEGPFAMAGQDSGYPYIISMQGIITELYKTNPSFNFKIVKEYEKQTVKKSKYIGCRTDFDKNFVKFINPSVNVLYAPEAMDPVFFRNNWMDNNTCSLLYVGSIIERKGVETLIKAIRIVKNQYPRVRLAMIGGGAPSYIDYLKNLGNQLEISDNFELLGFQNSETIADYHIKSDIFVFPSLNDNSPNAVAEAMASGIPVIASRVGGIPSMIDHGKTGILVKPNEPVELGQAIVNLLGNREKLDQISYNAKAVAKERYFPSTVADIALKNYKTILG